MDTSKEYVKMSDCPEIQEQWRVFSMRSPYELLWRDSPTRKHDNVWLPRQDQIQEMMYENNPWDSCGLATGLVNFIQGQQRFYKGGEVKKLYPVGSMEQLWLAFYMHEKHTRTWDGGKWVKSGK